MAASDRSLASRYHISIREEHKAFNGHAWVFEKKGFKKALEAIAWYLAKIPIQKAKSRIIRPPIRVPIFCSQMAVSS